MTSDNRGSGERGSRMEGECQRRRDEMKTADESLRAVLEGGGDRNRPRQAPRLFVCLFVSETPSICLKAGGYDALCSCENNEMFNVVREHNGRRCDAGTIPLLSPDEMDVRTH